MVKWRQMEWDEWKARPFDGRQTTDRPTTMTRARLWKSTEETDPGSAITTPAVRQRFPAFTLQVIISSYSSSPSFSSSSITSGVLKFPGRGGINPKSHSNHGNCMRQHQRQEQGGAEHTCVRTRREVSVEKAETEEEDDDEETH